MSEKINFDYNKMTPFKWFIIENYPFLEDSIDALDNYQLFCKLGDEINKNRDAINEIGLNAEALTEGYNSLVDYVNNYFNNLDVQNEINNKLDQMAEAGTLEEIISTYLETRAVFGFDSLASVIASDNLSENEYIRTFGKNSYNDGYSALYKIRTLTSADTVDNENIIALTNYPTLIAEKIKDYKKYITSTVHLSFDDVELSLNNLKNKSYTSIFNEPFFGMLKELHDKYNAIFSLYVYTDSFNTINKTSYQQDFIKNSDWLKIGFHATNVNSNFQNTTCLQAQTIYNTFITNVLNVCGTNLIIDRVPRLANYVGNPGSLQGLIKANNGIIGLLDADDDRVSYDNNEKSIAILAKNFEFYNPRNGLYHFRTNLRIENSTNLENDLDSILSSEYGTNRNIEIFSHEWHFYNGTTISNKNKLVTICEWIKEKHIPYEFLQNKISNNSGASDFSSEAQVSVSYNNGSDHSDYWRIKNTSLGDLKYGIALKSEGLPTYNGSKARISTGTVLSKPYNTNKIIVHTSLSGLQFNLVEFTCKICNSANINPNGYRGNQWNDLASNGQITLQPDTEYYIICFKKGDNTDFTDSDLLNNTIYVSYQ